MMIWQLLLSLICLVSSTSGDGNTTRVHIIFMNHLDVGYNGIPGIGYVNNVLNRYFEVHFPQALRLAEEMRQHGKENRFRYTTHPWLLNFYLNCPSLTLNNITLKCPNSTMQTAMKAAMMRGDILWHAGAMNMQFENMNSELLEASLNVSLRLDEQFQPYKSLRVLSQRDIPGMTNQVMPVLKRNRVAAISVGVNAGSYPPEVTREPFIWQDGSNQIIAIWHPGGYPNNPGDSPSNPGGISVRDCSMIGGVSEILCFSFRTDNSGPPQSPAEVLNTYKILRAEFPGAELIASTLEDFVEAIQPYKSLMQVVKTEIGDTWIQGVGCDPKKTADYKALTRAYTSCYKDGHCSYTDLKVQDSVRYLIKLAEHTWGVAFTPDQINYSNDAFRKARSGAAYVECENSWMEQRMFNTLAYTASKGSPLQSYMDEELKKIRPEIPNTKGYIVDKFDSNSVYTCGNYDFSFFNDGSLSRLRRKGGQSVANEFDRLARFVYRSYNEVDDARLIKLYGNPGYGKPNVTKNANPASKEWPLKVIKQYRTANNCSFVLLLRPVDPVSVTNYGAPQSVYVTFNFTESQVAIETVIVNKTTTRIEEALFFEFRVSTDWQRMCRWRLKKLEGYVDPLRVTYGGSVLQHAVNDHAELQCRQSTLQFKSPDVPLACPFNRQVEASPFPYLDRLSSVNGVSFNIYNNIWNTNFIYWYPYKTEDANFKARFNIVFTEL